MVKRMASETILSGLSSVPTFYKLVELRQIMPLLCASVSPSLKWVIIITNLE